MEMTSRQMLDAVDQALAEVSRRLASGELDRSGRYYTDAELKAGLATGAERSPAALEKQTVPEKQTASR